MKKTFLAVAVLGTLSSAAFAQSNLTIYGLYDTALRYTTNVDAAGNHKLALGDGALNGSKLGFKGEEDLGDGNTALFKLETGFGTQTGQLGQQGQIFGRAAYVGLKSKTMGEVDFGRQYALAFSTFFEFDPLHQGASNENSWQGALEGVRFDNTILYTKEFGPLRAQFQYSVGGQPGSTSIGTTTAAGLTYAEGPLGVTGVYQHSKDANSADSSFLGLGGSYAFGPAKVLVNYLDSRRDPGFARGANSTAAAPSSAPLANTNLSGNVGNTLQRKDSVWVAGLQYQTASPVSWTIGYMHDSVKNDASTGTDGSINTVYGVANYALSKRTDVYVSLDHTTLGGGEITSPNSPVGNFGGNTGRTVLALGLRTKF